MYTSRLGLEQRLRRRNWTYTWEEGQSPPPGCFLSSVFSTRKSHRMTVSVDRLQDIGQLVAIAVLLITFFQTNIFQVRRVLRARVKYIYIRRHVAPKIVGGGKIKDLVDLLSFRSIFQAGFIVLLFNEFRSTIITGVCYFLLTIFVQVWTLTNRFKGQVYFYWPDGLYVFFVLHKFGECVRVFNK